MVHERLARTRRFLGRAIVALIALGLTAVLLFLPFAGARSSPKIRSSPRTRLSCWTARAPAMARSRRPLPRKLAPHIVLSSGRLEQAEMRLRSLGVRYPTSAELARDAIVQLRVPADAVAIMPSAVDNTAQEAAALLARATEAGWHRVIVVTSISHPPRPVRVHPRVQGSAIQIVMHGSRYDAATPARWWSDRADIRFVGVGAGEAGCSIGWGSRGRRSWRAGACAEAVRADGCHRRAGQAGEEGAAAGLRIAEFSGQSRLLRASAGDPVRLGQSFARSRRQYIDANASMYNGTWESNPARPRCAGGDRF